MLDPFGLNSLEEIFMRTSSKKLIAHLTLLAMILCLPLSAAYAKAGCCSSHGGVARCDTSSGFLACNDSTLSKTCQCDGTSAVSKSTEKPVKPTKSTTKTTTAATTTAAPASTTTKAPKGCCSKHGGVGSCDIKTGFYMCKDGTQSASCKCQ